ncbi:gephyrin-like molybdotransferase receptor GlpR [Streptomyces sp. 135]|uniref:divisome protein SepX/GlpR n=1 Tax=Streptomyces sp. 135 TaxID=2838850 RepID=UPI001CBDD3B0|nr:gephyrin-like molybdotransferase receptor GlpR [Streptomyces sp. 135]
MSSSGLIYAVIVGAWAAYLVPMWLRRQDELNEARPTERFSTAIRLLSGRAGMERRYAKDLQARSPEEGETRGEPDDATGSVDVRAFAVPPTERVEPQVDRAEPVAARSEPPARQQAHPDAEPEREQPPRAKASPAQRAASAEAAARARRSKVLARRRRTTMLLFLAFTAGAVVAGVGGLAFLWAPAAPAVLLSAYIVYLRGQERRRFTYTMDRRRAEAAAQRLRENRPRRRPASAEPVVDEEREAQQPPETETGLSALAADRRALVEQTDHAEWVDQQRERQRGPGRGDSWDPVPVPLPTYVTAPVAPRATGSVDLGAPDTWSSARSSTAEPAAEEARRGAGTTGAAAAAGDIDAAEGSDAAGGRSDKRRAASARRARERGRTPLFDQYEDGDRPRAANE